MTTPPILHSPHSGTLSSFARLITETRQSLRTMCAVYCTKEEPVLFLAVYFRKGERSHGATAHSIHYRTFISRDLEEVFSSRRVLLHVLNCRFDRLRVFQITKAHNTQDEFGVMSTHFQVSQHMLGCTNLVPTFVFFPTASRITSEGKAKPRWRKLI